jgi:hypothetical protein
MGEPSDATGTMTQPPRTHVALAAEASKIRDMFIVCSF